MTTLVTGAAGFVGLNVLEALGQRHREIVAIDRLAPGLEESAFPQADIRFRVGDLRDDDFLDSVFSPGSIRTVVHLATVTANGAREYESSGALVELNVGCVERLLKTARRYGCERVVYVGSGSAYGKAWDSPSPLREEQSPSWPDSLYGITKLAGEQIALRLGELSGLDVRAVRLGTVVGPWERETGAREAMSVYLQVARLALRREEAVLPRVLRRRDWIYSRDAAAGIVALAEAPHAQNRLYHLTSGCAWQDGLSRWCATLASAFDGFSWRSARVDEAPNVVDSAARDRAPMLVERIRQDVGFEARFGPAEACDDFLQWLKRNQEFVLNLPLP